MEPRHFEVFFSVLVDEIEGEASLERILVFLIGAADNPIIIFPSSIRTLIAQAITTKCRDFLLFRNHRHEQPLRVQISLRQHVFQSHSVATSNNLIWRQSISLL